MKYFLWVIILSISIQGFTQTPAPLGKDPKAKEILEKVSKKYKAFKNLKAEFSFKLINKKEKINDKKDGTVYLSGSKYRLELLGATTLSDGKSIWTLLKESQEVNISSTDPNDKSIFNQPSKLFTMYDTGFKYKLLGEKKEGVNVYYEIELFPENLDLDLFGKGKNKNNLKKINLKIDKKLMQIASIDYLGKDGVDYSIVIKSFKSDVVVPESMFVFNKAQYPNYEIVDLRD